MKIVVAGGGTAGWLTALMAKKYYPKYDIILIESQDIGILGAGEGSTPILIGTLRSLDIEISEILKNTDATIKNGIKFTNWSVDKKYFYHPFISNIPYSNDFEKEKLNYCDIIPYHKKDNESDYVLSHKMSDINKVFIFNKEGDIVQDSPMSLHFNARKLASYLKNVAEKRDIRRIEGIIEDFKLDKDGNIIGLKIKDKFIECDFVFDCTGFHRYFIGNIYKTKWKSHKTNLPAKKAIPFFINNTEVLPPYTESIAMNYGWMWKIPTQERFGCGYVYDSDMISDEEAKREIDNLIGYEVESPKTFSFEAGCYEKIWINNCLAVGLSAGFIEPLEATSIMHSIFSLETFFSIPNCFLTKNDKEKNKFNQNYLSQTNEIVDFIYLHYVTKKSNTEFWTNFTKNNLMPEKIKYVLSISKDRPMIKFDFEDRMFFKHAAYNYILKGNDLVNFSNFKILQNEIIKYNEMIKIQNENLHKYFDHKVLINQIKNGTIKI